MKIARHFLGALALGVLAAAPTAFAQTPYAYFLGCHGDTEMKRGDGRPMGQDLGRLPGSVHGPAGVLCVDCHADLARTVEFPHAEKLTPPQCVSCHSDEVTKHAASVHARAAGGRGARCADCHGAHDMKPSTDAQSATYHLNLTRTCGRCHADPGVLGDRAKIPSLFADSIHGEALARHGLVVSPNCATCHGSHHIRAPDDPQSTVHRLQVPSTCGSCHEGIRAPYDASVHGAAVKSGNDSAAVCSDCHTAHSIKATVPSWRLEVVRECGTCHEESIHTYRDGFHGQASALGYTRVATCADCHTAHGILPKSDPRSSVSPQRRVETCRRCHPGVNARFAAFDPHANPDDRERSRPVYYTARLMKMLLAAVFTFFGVHTMLWLPRSWQARIGARHHDLDERPAPEGEDEKE